MCPVKYEYIFKGWFTDPRTKQNQIITFKFTKLDVFYAKLVKDSCYPSLNTISDDTGISLSTVKRAIPELANKGYLKKINRKKANGSATSNLYKFTDKVY